MFTSSEVATQTGINLHPTTKETTEWIATVAVQTCYHSACQSQQGFMLHNRTDQLTCATAE